MGRVDPSMNVAVAFEFLLEPFVYLFLNSPLNPAESYHYFGDLPRSEILIRFGRGCHMKLLVDFIETLPSAAEGVLRKFLLH